ncbi:uncharacterized protein H6S33_006101 [Morchella sextelata]|uniref:uncharacterized protein n=1 Tax=Morchella sextelata TaxID=1174677 RepID=UPI001D048725|nr:uncharacterized protein H6S33_006101 [Morchella sextelata]KAH0614215.1 hypothetical protein H6S33_006101 [Morchella sextelata]
MVSLTRSSDNLDLLLYDAAATPLIEPPAPSNASLSEILTELAHLINEREASKHTTVEDDNEDEVPQYDPAVIGQLETITSEMQTMNNRLSRAIWQMDNGFDGVGIRMTRLNNRLCAIENGLKSLREEPGGKVLERAALEHNRRARIHNSRVKSQEKLMPMHTPRNVPVPGFTADTPYKLANEHQNQDKIIEWLDALDLSTERKGCHMRLTEFVGVPWDRVLDNMEVWPKVAS